MAWNGRDLTTLEAVKVIWEVAGTDYDAMITQAIEPMSIWLAAKIGRRFSWVGGEVTEELNYLTSTVSLEGWPVTEITSVKEASTPAGLDDAEALTEGVHFIRREQRVADFPTWCRIIRIGSSGHRTDFKQHVKVVYTHGYATLDDVPALLRDLAAGQVAHVVMHASHFGQRTVNVGTSEISQVEPDLLKEFHDAIKDWKRTGDVGVA